MTVTDKIKSDIGHIPKNIFLKNHIIVLQKPYLHEYAEHHVDHICGFSERTFKLEI